MGSLSAADAFRMAFERAFNRLDVNGDGLLQWARVDSQGKLHPDQPGPEPLPASYDACYLIDYLHHPATTEKDPAHPGQYVQTPETYEIAGWKTWKEVLAHVDGAGYPALTPTGGCDKTELKAYCVHKGGFEEPLVCTFGVCNCHPGQGGDTIVNKQVCTAPKTAPTAFTKDAWLALAADHFKREDWNHDGKLDAAESAEFVCPAEP